MLASPPFNGSKHQETLLAFAEKTKEMREMTTAWRQRQRAKMKWQNKQPYLKNKYSMYNLLCVLIKINRQSITCLLREVFTTIHRHGGRTLAQEDTDREDRWRDDRVVEKTTKQFSVWVNVCLNPEDTHMHWEGRKEGESLWCPLLSYLQITVLCGFDQRGEILHLYSYRFVCCILWHNNWKRLGMKGITRDKKKSQFSHNWLIKKKESV